MVIMVAENMIHENKSVEKVIIMDCIPRFDFIENDPFGLKTVLAKLSIHLKTELINKSIFKEQIVARAHSIEGNEANYGNPDFTHFDGIHLYGYRGCDTYTKSILHILGNDMNIHKTPRDIPPRNRSHKTSWKATEARTASNPAASSTSTPSPSVAPPGSSTRTSGSSVYQYAVKTFNRFSHFLH